MFHKTTKVVMVVDTVSPTPFALLRRAKNFEYRSEDRDLQEFSLYEDPVHVLTDECRRVLRSISSSNQQDVSKASDSTGLRDTSWSRFEDIGFSGAYDESDADSDGDFNNMAKRNRQRELNRNPHSRTNDLGRPTTPSWADFLSSGFVDDQGRRAPALLLPPDKVLPPINTTQRGHSSQSHRRNLDTESDLEPGELANINKFDMDDAFWWVWISSLAGEESTARKAVFGRCALLETVIPSGRWLVMEEQVKGAAVEPAPGAYVAEKKGFFSFASRKGKVNRRKSGIKRSPLGQDLYQGADTAPSSKTTIGPDQHAKIQAAAAALQQKNMEKELPSADRFRRGRIDDAASTKTSSVFTLQPVIMSEASPAMKWASQYDKAAIRAKYLGDSLAGKGASTEMLTLPTNGIQPTPHQQPAAPPKEARQPVQPTIEEKPEPSEPEFPVQPPPLPAAPVQQMQPINEEVTEAAEVPLPIETPVQQPEQQQAVTAEAPETPTKEVPAPDVVAQETPDLPQKKSPDHKDHKKLKKRNQPGFKGIFGNKKAPPQEAKPTSVENATAVAAARAALEGKQSPPPNSGKTSPVDSKAGRFAGLRSRPAHRAAQLAPPARKPAAQRPDQPESPTPVTEDSAHPSSEAFKVDRPRTQRDDEYDQLSRVDTDEAEDADREFSKFDQGHVPDHPAYTVDEATPVVNESYPADIQQPKPVLMHYAAATVDHTVPEEDEGEYDEDELPERGSIPIAMAQTSTPSPPSQDVSPVQIQDRWAQIRKNAAERAARQSEEQSRVSNTDKTDDGETSGEESKLSSIRPCRS